jgi:hypothetical protein
MNHAEDSMDQSSARPAPTPFDRLEERKITIEDLYQLKLWRESESEAPEGLWYEDFCTFKICGEGKFPKTFLLKGQAAKGKPL